MTTANDEFEAALQEHVRRGGVMCAVLLALQTLTPEQQSTTLEEVRPVIHAWFTQNMTEEMAWVEAHTDPDFAFVRAMIFPPNTEAQTLCEVSAREAMTALTEVVNDINAHNVEARNLSASLLHPDTGTCPQDQDAGHRRLALPENINEAPTCIPSSGRVCTWDALGVCRLLSSNYLFAAKPCWLPGPRDNALDSRRKLLDAVTLPHAVRAQFPGTLRGV